MDRFRQSKRMSIHKRETVTYPGVFSTFSPQKKNTFESQPVDESPNTSRLPQPSLQKEVSSLRKYQQAQQKLRQKQAAHHHLIDMYDKVTKEKQGIEASLSQQIEMYRSLIKEIQEKAQERLRKIQLAFKEQMERKLAEKEDEMKVVLGEKQELETFVNELERIGDELESKLANTVIQLKKNEQALIKCEKGKDLVQEKLEALEEHSKAQIQKLHQNIESLKQKVVETERQWRNKLDEAGKQRQRSLKDQEKEFKQELNKIEAKHEREKNDRKQQFKQTSESFDAEKGRLNEVIQSKQKLIQDNHREAKQIAEKQNIIIRSYEQEIQALANEKSRLFEEINSLNTENANLNILMKEIQSNSSNEKKNLQVFVLKLKQDLAQNQSNYLRERDRNVAHFQDSSKQIVVIRRQLVCLQAENDRLRSQIGDSATLRSQIRKLREMLMQSSYQLQRVKEQYVKLVKQRDYIALRINDVSYDTIATKRNKYDRDEEAKTWRQPSYSTRSRSIRR